MIQNVPLDHLLGVWSMENGLGLPWTLSLTTWPSLWARLCQGLGSREAGPVALPKVAPPMASQAAPPGPLRRAGL